MPFPADGSIAFDYLAPEPFRDGAVVKTERTNRLAAPALRVVRVAKAMAEMVSSAPVEAAKHAGLDADTTKAIHVDIAFSEVT